MRPSTGDKSARSLDTLTSRGWTVLPAFFEPSCVESLAATIDALGMEADRRLSPADGDPRACAAGGLIVVPERERPDLVARYEGVLAFDPRLRDRLVPRLTRAIDEACGETFVPFKDKVNTKYPGGGGYGPHQDFTAYAAFGPRYHITAMIMIDAGTRANGCLEIGDDFPAFVRKHPDAVVRWEGSHAILQTEAAEGGHGDISRDIADKLAWRPLETGPSDLVLFDSFVPHRSSVNGTNAPRRALFVTFASKDAGDWYDRYYQAKRADPLDPQFHVSTPTRSHRT
jgi:2-aminoethylphosphonate dioxygenase